MRDLIPIPTLLTKTRAPNRISIPTAPGLC